MRRLLFVIAVLVVSAMPATAQHQSRIFSPNWGGEIFSHNGSTMQVRLHRGMVEIVYLFTHPRLPLSVQRMDEVVLFEGDAEPIYKKGLHVGYTNRVAGTAYTFSTACGEHPYKVRGEFSPDFEKLVLRGPAPDVDLWQCKTVGYSWADHNARLEFYRDRRPIVE